MKLSLLSETKTKLPPKGLKDSRQPAEEVWQTSEHQGKRGKDWDKTGTPVGGDAGQARWGTGKPMTGDGHEEHILPVGK